MRFKIFIVLHYCRRGASSGILLGAVTLPAVMMCKLVQLTRAISLHQAEQDGIFPHSLYSYYDFLCCDFDVSAWTLFVPSYKKTCFNLCFVELAHVTMQYWAASASCCAILIYLSVVMSQGKKNECSSSSVWLTRVSLTGTVLYGAACFVSLSMISHTGN